MARRTAVVKKGQLVFKKALPFPDGTRVRVQIERAEGDVASPEDRSGNLDPLVFAAEHAIDTGIPDLAEEHDHYIYGTPKRNTKKR